MTSSNMRLARFRGIHEMVARIALVGLSAAPGAHWIDG